MNTTSKLITMLLVLLCSVGAASAQTGTGDGDTPPVFPTFVPPPEDATVIDFEDITLPEEFDLAAIAERFSENNPEAYAAISGFSAAYFGASLEPVFAQKRGGGILANSDVISDVADDIVGQLSDEAQVLYAAVDQADLVGALYYGLLDDGFAVVITADDCSGRRCTVALDELQLNIENAALGMYAVNVDGSVESSEAAYDLVISTFPAMANVPLVEADATIGYAFAYSDSSMTGGISYFFSVATSTYPDGSTTKVYGRVGTGEGYVALGEMLP